MNGSASMNTVFQDTSIPNHDNYRNLSNDVFTSYRVRVQQPLSSWSQKVSDRLAELTSLPIGWDGYNGQPVSFPCAYFTANMLERLCQDGVPAPNLVPGSDGSLQVEWHRNMFDVELDVLDAQMVVATRVDLTTDEEEVLEIQNDFSNIVHWISALSNETETTGND
ncbi:MAG: hypothetical protein AB2704_26065 [Candidatus Thiodiazotropha taylori]